MYTREDKPDDPHIWGTWGRKSLDTLLSIHSGNHGIGGAMYCLAKWRQRSWQIPASGGRGRSPSVPSRRGPPGTARHPPPSAPSQSSSARKWWQPAS